ncbi:D-alanyl-D-alanine carboxypeptidase [Micrococcus endophyticus]|uniref:D-alanyl-D-alanine carboxypeptidase/D-alanyl-D-alanine-endopeptidase (Penicillin-binding protein 4) n=1 Tax=Micrococcus endophyticus TaxID=455343 RepID=A0A7W9N0Z6_9MICC|nr:D-alanyl-D-alanine carboxypeptidase/D-alanyl-D-alanine-endopeptidase (penicillin-binding protein 4) [Micrococcus endophyticus]
MTPGSPFASLLAALAAALLSAAPVLTPLAGPAALAPGNPVTAEAMAAPSPDARALASAVDAALDASPGRVAAQVRDAATGEVLHARDADSLAAPASSLKVLTAAAALRTLGPERTLRTRVVAAPAADDGATELVLVGGGDVLLGDGASDPDAVAGRAGLRTLAERTVAGLAEAGVSGDVVVSVDLRLFDGAAVNPAWTPDLLEDGHVSAVQPLATWGGREAPGVDEERIEDPAGHTALVFQRLLDEEIERTGADLDLGLRDTIPATTAVRDDVVAAEPTAQVESAPVAEVAAYMLAHSENQVAEALGRLSAYAVGRPATHEGAADLLEDVAADLGADTAGMAVLDASGLAEGSLVSPAQLAAVVSAASRVPWLAPVLDGLPRPGEDSTLDERFRGTAAEGAVAAKTGTLDHTVSLTGTVTTQDGRVLAFSIVASDLDWKLDEAREAVDAAVTAMAGL